MKNNWLSARLKEIGKTQAALAEHLALPKPRISEIISGQRAIGGKEVKPIAEFLETSVGQVLAWMDGATVAPAEIEAIMVKGAIQAGVFSAALEWPPEEWRPAPVAPDPRYKRVAQFGLQVRGPSMNLLYPPDTVIVCVNLIELGRDPEPGDRVVCLRRHEHGGEWEATVKELRRDPAGEYWLWPRSSDPNFQQPWRLPKPDSTDENDDIRLVAKVIGSYRPE